MLEILLAVLIIIGALFTLIGALGLARMPDFYTRLHGPTKATTVGVGSLLIASMMHFSTQTGSWSIHEVLVTLFLFITAPVSAHLLSKAALHLRVRSLSEPPPLIAATAQAEFTSAAPPSHPSPAPQPTAPQSP